MRQRSTSSVRYGAVAIAIAGLSLVSACDRASAGGTTAPSQERGGTVPDNEDPHQGDSFEELKQRLRELGNKQPSMVEPAAADPAVCEDLCDLGRAICSTRVKLCELADQHPEDEAYQDLCREAKMECSEATESCIACVQTNAQRRQTSG